MSTDNYLKELQNKAFDLCLAIYRMLKLYPENEALVNQTKQLSNEMTADILVIDKGGNISASEISLDIEKLIVFLQIARAQSWINAINFDFLIKGYRKLAGELAFWESNFRKVPIKQITGPPKQIFQRGDINRVVTTTVRKPAGESIKKQHIVKELNQRQKKILDFLKRKNEAKMADLNSVFKNEVTERTLRNDLQDLVAQGMIKTQGEFKTRKYYIKN